jgi:hypothetical protein
MAYFHFRPFTWPQARVMALGLTVLEAELLDWQVRYIWKKMLVFLAGIFTFWKKIHYSIFGVSFKLFTEKFPKKREVH